ncbi:LamG-like jellyroll fold domain-containing protein [Streptomyces sp. NRRL B-3648]|uniref:LamG-like jellyroll fold domain-containing protein n=1 Tax=Streptomyces sp. NRRL B-3648 TaxID=1519493 RepID=UPI002D21CFD5|nr:LamG-like jellyroll fold domain-containing protein [Streptomyces sp. NRRL B-3648]
MTLGLLPPTNARGADRSGVPASQASVTSAAASAEPVVAGTEAEAMARAKSSDQPVEITSLRGESSEVFANPDGRLTAREHLRPVRMRVGGVWKPIDTDLTRTADGMVAPKAATIGLEFSGGGDVPMVKMTKAGRELALSWPGKLPTPQLRGDTATYSDVLPGVDLQLGAQQDGFTQLLVVKSADAASSKELAELRLRLDADGMDVKETSAGGLQAVDQGAGSAVFEAAQPLMWDSSTGASTRKTGGPQPLAGSKAATGSDDTEPAAAESGRLAPVGVEVPAGQNELVLTPDAEILRGKDTVYPVFIDPKWDTPKATAWTVASKYWASSPQWKFNGDADAGMGYCGWYYCKPYDTKRLFYQLPVSKYAGTDILSAEFVVRNTWSASCGARSVQLWRTKGISSSTTWNSQNESGFWVDHLATDSFAYGFEGCAAKDAEFNVKSAVQQAADKNWSTMTFGLRAGDESDEYGWKRFSDDAYLRVKYNRPPSQIKMSKLRMDYGGTCKKPSDAPRVRTLGQIHADEVTDPDGEQVAVQFQAKWDAGDGKGLIARWKPPLTTYKKSGSDFVVSLPTSIPAGKTVNWYARSYDGAQYSPWSYTGGATGCYFVYDTSVPKAPTISSGEYPASDPENPDDPWFDGVGKYGSFELKGANTDVVKYSFGVNEDPSSKNTLTTSGGAAKTAKILPSKPGLNFITAKAFDAAGNASEIRTYAFRVKAGQPERGMWQLNDAAGASTTQGTAPARAVELGGGATPHVPGAKGTAVSFDGADDYAATDIPAIDTAGSFSVSAWVKLAAVPDHAAVAVTQPGNNSPGFEIYYSAGYDRWVFSQHTSDTPDANSVKAMPATGGGVKAGEWTHLVGTYSSGSDELKLYINNQLAGTATYSSPWDARRGLQFGAASLNGSRTNFFPGAIDEVQIFDKPLSAAEVTQLYGKSSLTAGRPARAVFSMEEPAEATQLTGRAEVPDATLMNGAKPGQPGIADKALTLDGVDDYATTGRPVLNNQSSFAISAWAKLPKTKPDHAAVVATQAGIHRAGLELYYSQAFDRWVVSEYSADSSDATPIRAIQAEGQTAYGDTWTHLVGVHDTVANKLILYVNGTKAGETDLQANWYAGGAVQIGAGSYDGRPGSFFPGQIDDVRLFDRPTSAQEIQQLFRQRPLVKGRWTFAKASGSPLVTPDDSAWSNDMTLNGGARLDTGWVDGGVSLDGVNDYGVTSAVPVDTGSSFTVTAWAQAAAIPTKGVTLLSVPGSTKSAFTVRYEPSGTPGSDPGRWRIAMASADSTSATVTQVDNSQFHSPTEWTHLALVYDGFSKHLTLYVNGEPEVVACKDDDSDGDADDPACTDRFSWADDVLAFKAAQPMQLGRAKTGASTWGEYWPGAVSDVWAFQGTLTDPQIEVLATGQPGMATDVPGAPTEQ